MIEFTECPDCGTKLFERMSECPACHRSLVHASWRPLRGEGYESHTTSPNAARAATIRRWAIIIAILLIPAMCVIRA